MKYQIGEPGRIIVARFSLSLFSHPRTSPGITGKRKHVAMAREACVARKWEDCSDDKLMMYVFRFDEKNPMAFLNKVDKDYAQNSE